jgi:dihydroorotate dehydrogenase
MYQIFFKFILKRLDPEFAHHLGAILIKALGIVLPTPKPGNKVAIAGIDFQNRIGMAAGFDKNAELIVGLYKLGFGHVEVGTVTPKPQSGNPKPRLFRLAQSRALINRMGFNNDGAEVIAQRIRKLRQRGKPLPIIGINIGKNKVTEPAQAVDDYIVCAELLAPQADYLAVNVSSPNTPGLRDLQQVESLRPILKAVHARSFGKPVFVKISPDLSDDDVIAIAHLVEELGLAGVIAANTTVSRPIVSEKHLDQSGGLSGPMLAQRSEEMLVLLRAAIPNRTLISVGGVQGAEDFAKRLKLGADLVQGYTGFVYVGPSFARVLRRGETQATA